MKAEGVTKEEIQEGRKEVKAVRIIDLTYLLNPRGGGKERLRT